MAENVICNDVLNHTYTEYSKIFESTCTVQQQYIQKSFTYSLGNYHTISFLEYRNSLAVVITLQNIFTEIYSNDNLRGYCMRYWLTDDVPCGQFY